MKPKAHIGLLMWDRRVPSQRQRGFSFIFFLHGWERSPLFKKAQHQQQQKETAAKHFFVGERELVTPEWKTLRLFTLKRKTVGFNCSKTHSLFQRDYHQYGRSSQITKSVQHPNCTRSILRSSQTELGANIYPSKSLIAGYVAEWQRVPRKVNVLTTVTERFRV